MGSLDHTTSLPEVKAFRMSFGLWLGLLITIAIGCIGYYLITTEDSTRAWFNFLVGTAIFTGFGLYGLFMLLINTVVKARWHIVLRRIYETMALSLPFAGILVAIVFVGREHIYEWTNAAIVAEDEIIQGKMPYLSEGFFMWRLVVYFTIWIASAVYIVRNSVAQDIDGELRYTSRIRALAPIMLVAYALSVTAFAFDLLMSVEPHWFSTIYGVYYFAMFFQAGHVFTFLAAWWLNRPGYLKGYVNDKHFHDMGKFLFAFSIFWAYIAFSQFMLYWYGDIPEETFWYQYRMKEGWEWIALSVLILRWVIPFLALMPYAAKKTPAIVIPVGLLVLYGHWLDIFWNVMPATRLMHHGAHAAEHGSHFGAGYEWQDMVSGLGFIALFILVFGIILQSIRLLPSKDPHLADSIHHH